MEIIRQGIRILRPSEFRGLLRGCKKTEYRTMLQALLYSGMRYVELKALKKHPEWFDGEFIHIPYEKKKKRSQPERWVRLNQPGKMIIEYYLNLKRSLPSYQSWTANLRCWAKRGGISEKGLSAKTTRKTWESWLMFYYPDQITLITLSQGHNEITSLRHYLNLPFTENDRMEMKNYVEGWI